MFLINEAFTLINQTSLVAESRGLPHGVLMADSTRYDPDCAFQIDSAQTLAIRQWPKSDLIIINEDDGDLCLGDRPLSTHCRRSTQHGIH